MATDWLPGVKVDTGYVMMASMRARNAAQHYENGVVNEEEARASILADIEEMEQRLVAIKKQLGQG